MHSSISSSNDRLPHVAWRKAGLTAVMLVIGFLAVWNAYWVSNGFPLEPKDNSELWSYHRRRASKLGEDAVVLTGTSRIKAGIDLNEAAAQTGKTPIQLAIAARSPVLVLKSLADDESFRGTVVAEITEYTIYSQMDEKLDKWANDYKENSYGDDFVFPLKSGVQSLIASPNLGETTSKVLTNIATGKTFQREFLNRIAMYRTPTTTFNRSSQGYADDSSAEILEQRRQFSLLSIKKAVAERPPDKKKFLELANRIESYTRRIQARGGKVVLVNFPLNGEIKELNEKYFPKADFWDALVAVSSAKTVYYADHPSLASIETLDGTHFSGANAALFTRELFKIISR